MKVSHKKKKKKAAPLKDEDQCKLPARQQYYLTHLQMRVPIVARREHCTDSGRNKLPSILFFFFPDCIRGTKLKISKLVTGTPGSILVMFGEESNR